MQNSKFNIESQSSPGWFERSQKCAQLIFSLSDRLGTNPSLADVGCGDQKLRNCLISKNISFRYQGFDIYPQSSDVIMFDANSDELGKDYDVIASLGLTEYVDLKIFLSKMRKRCQFFVVSHVLSSCDLYSKEDVERLGWINHLSSDDFESNLLSAKFNLLQAVMTKNNKIKIWLCN
jgi:hypothetical protein